MVPMLICVWQTSILLWLSSLISRKLIPLCYFKVVKTKKIKHKSNILHGLEERIFTNFLG